MNYTRNMDYPFNHAVIHGCGFCAMSQEDRSSIIQALPALVRGHALWLQYQPRAASEALHRMLPSACIEAQQEWLLQAIGDTLFAVGYFPDQRLSPDPVWIWGGNLEDLG